MGDAVAIVATSLFRLDVRTKSEVRQRCDERKSETNEQRQMFTTSQTLNVNVPQIYWSKTSDAMLAACNAQHCGSDDL